MKNSTQRFVDECAKMAASFEAFGDSLSTMVSGVVEVRKVLEAMSEAMCDKIVKSDAQLVRERVATLRKRSLRLRARRAVEAFQGFIRRR